MENSANLCAARLQATALFDGQNGKTFDQSPCRQQLQEEDEQEATKKATSAARR